MTLAAATAGAPVAGADLAGPIAEEPAQDAVFDQHGALGRHALIVHGQGSKGPIGETLINGGDGGVGNLLAQLLGKGGGAALDLGGFEQMAAGFMENDAAEAVRQHYRKLARFDIVSPQHGGGAVAEIAGRLLGLPLAQFIGTAMGAVAAAQAGAVVAIGGQYIQTQGLVQANVVGMGAIAGDHQHVLPVAGITAAPHLQVLAQAAELVGAFQQASGGLLKAGALSEPITLGHRPILQRRQPFVGVEGVAAAQ